MKEIFNFLIIIVFTLLLIACGGDSASDQNKIIDSNQLKPLFTLSNKDAQANANLAISAAESMLQLAQYSDQIIQKALSEEIKTSEVCENGGSRTLIVNKVATGNAIKDQLNNCFVAALNATVSGEIELTIQNFERKQEHSFVAKLQLNFVNAYFKDSSGFRLQRPIVVDLTSELFSRSTRITPAANFVQLVFDDGESFSFRDFTLQSEIDFSSAQYQSQFSGLIESAAFRSALTVSTTTPITGFIREFPYQGEMQLVDTVGNKLQIKVEDRPYPHALEVKFNNENKTSYLWRELSEGHFWIWPGVVNDKFDIEPYHPNNMRLIGTLENLQQIKFSPNKSIHVLFSRPVKHIKEDTTSPRFRSGRHNIPDVDANLTILGSAVMVQPVSPLTPRATYNLPSFWVASERDAEGVFLGHAHIKVSDELIAIISANRTAFSKMDTIELSAENSIQLNPGQLTYHWRELSQSGVQFDSVDAKQVRVTFPVSVPNTDVIVELQVRHADGTAHFAHMTLYYYDKSLPVLYVDIKQQSDPLAKPQTLFIINAYDDDSPTQKYNLNLNMVVINQNKNNVEYKYIKLGLSNSTEDNLTPGHYALNNCA